MDIEIFNKPEVYKPVSDGGLEKPMQTDIRGSIQRFDCGGMKLNLLFTKKGFMRSGDLHKNTQFDFIVRGRIELWLREEDGDEKRVHGPNDFIQIPPGVPHLFSFLEDTVMAEWWDGPFEAWYYKPYRDIIDRQFKRMTAL